MNIINIAKELEESKKISGIRERFSKIIDIGNNMAKEIKGFSQFSRIIKKIDTEFKKINWEDDEEGAKLNNFYAIAEKLVSSYKKN